MNRFLALAAIAGLCTFLREVRDDTLIRQGQGALGTPEVFGGEFWRFYSNADPTDRVAIGEDEAARMLEGHSREKLFEPPADE